MNAPRPAEEVRAQVQSDRDRLIAQRIERDPDYIKRLRGAVRGEMGKVIQDDERRHLILGWLFAKPEDKFMPRSSNDLSPAELMALKMWMKPYKLDEALGGFWLNDPQWETELEWVGWQVDYEYAEQEGQMRLFD